MPDGLNLNIFGSAGSYLTLFKNILIIIAITLVAIIIIAVIFYRRAQNKKYNIPLIIFTPRSDGTIPEISKGWGGYFKSKRVGGITSFRIKRKGIGVIDIPPPPSSYLMAPERTLFLAQKGVDDYEPINPNQLLWVDTEVEVEEDGKRKIIIVKKPILNLKAINQSATAWAFDNEETAKRRFTFMSIWDKYQSLITMMIFIFLLFLIMYIQYMGLKDVVAELKNFVIAVKGNTGGTTAPIITQGG